jgi:L,D-transpeptidase catalytic domain
MKARSGRIALALAAAILCVSCFRRHEPPGVRARPRSSAVVRASPSASSASSAAAAADGGVPQDKLGTIDDNLPFVPHGTKLASIAWRTWIYTDTGPTRTRFGYLRAGAIVDARGPAIKNDGCKGGWYRINPRGFVCIGKGATLDLNNPIVIEESVRAVRGQSLPYVYARAGDTPPLRYFRLPTKAEMLHSEGDGMLASIQRFWVRMQEPALKNLLGTLGPPPDFLAHGQSIVKPYGVPKHLHFLTHSEATAPGAGFAITRTFQWQGRPFGLTTELDVIALDRTNVVVPSDFHGVTLADDESLPVGFVMSHYALEYELDAAGQLRAKGSLDWRQGLKLTGRTRPGDFHEVQGGDWIAGGSLRIIAPRTSFPSFATGSRKWIDISIEQQSLVAYIGRKPVYVTLVSTGLGGMGDPDKVPATARGTFMIHSKHVSITMDSSEDKSDSYNLLDVPFVQYFHKGYALHGTYWHNDFGRIRSHGCVNLAPIDAAWLFEWTDPAVPPGWHGALNMQRGTVVYVHG